MLNHIVIMGRMTKDVDIRHTQNNVTVGSFCVAVDRDYKPDGGERECEFFDCVAWRGSAEFVSKYFHKGDPICVTGRMQSRTYTDRDGNKRRAWELVAENVYFAGSKKESNGTYAPADFQPIEGDDDKLPF